MPLPIKLPLDQMQTLWKSQIDPALGNSLINGTQLIGINLINGTTVINHKLGRKLQGWFLTGLNAAATIYDQQSSNPSPQLTLILHSSASCLVNIWVF